MKKNIICFLIAITCTAVFAAPSYMNNTYQKLADEYTRAAQNAFNAGQYERAVELSALAEENAMLSRAYIDSMMVRQAAEDDLLKANSRLTWAKSINADKSYPMAFSAAEESMAKANAAFKSEDYPNTSKYANEVLANLANIQDDNKALPEYYVVRPWADTRDCLWNIAGRSYVYNNPWLWENIYDANKNAFPDPKDPNVISVGTKLRIPSLSGEYREGEWSSSRTYDTYEHKRR